MHYAIVPSFPGVGAPAVPRPATPVRGSMSVGHDIILVGASAGGMQALVEILRDLPRDLPAAVFVVIHTAPSSPGILPQILDRASPLPVTHAEDGEAVAHGRVYVTPPDHHMLLKAEGNGAARDVAEGGDNALQTGIPGLHGNGRGSGA